tara:strand:- start:37 stop:1974 length:1938 start_codon:yes stop_codon:yes gene_type:complete
MAYNSETGNAQVVNYLNRDFLSLRKALVDFSKTYYPESYKDFNETSPGMMLMEMTAYVGDVLNFYVDKQFREMFLPLAKEKSNIIHLAHAFGYKVKPVKPATVELTFTQDIDSDTSDPNNVKPNYSALTSQTQVIDTGTQIKSNVDDTIIFETLGEVDFTVSGSGDTSPIPVAYNDTGLVSTYRLTRTVKAISGTRTTLTQTIDAPTKFLNVTIPENNVVDVVSVTDSAGNQYHEVDFLTQDRVPVETHYTDDSNRSTAYTSLDGTTAMSASVPYSLKYISAPKRFTTEIDSTTRETVLVFGNGLLRSGTSGSLKSNFLEIEQVGLSVPGTSETLSSNIDIRSGDAFGTLGEAPSNTTLTITYRAGGGIKSNVSAGELTTINDSNVTVTNLFPARGGSDVESEEEIRRRALAFFASQARCVSKDDYFGRVMQMSGKFGSIAKAYVDRSQIDANTEEPGTVRIYVLGYDNQKQLIKTPSLTKHNLKNYLNEFKMITDDVIIQDGFFINFGVVFDVQSYPQTDKSELKLKVIETIADFFNIDKMQFKQPIHLGELEYELLGIDGLRNINSIYLTQDTPPEGQSGPGFEPALYNYNNVGEVTNNNIGYGYPYGINSEALTNSRTVLPSVDPAVFELRDPDNNIKGVVR